MMIYSPALPATLALLGLAYWQFGIGGVIGIVIAALLCGAFR